MKLITVYTLPRNIECNNTTTWDAESLMLTSTTICSQDTETRSVIQYTIDESTGVPDLSYTLHLGDIELLLDANKHLTLLETRTNKKQWKYTKLEQMTSSIEKVWPDFRVVFDDNHIASVDLHYEMIFDESVKTLAISFVNEQSIENWVELSDHCFMALDGNHHLKELRLTNVNL